MSGSRLPLFRTSATTVTSLALAAAFVLSGCSSSSTSGGATPGRSTGAERPASSSSPATTHAGGGGHAVSGTGFCREAVLAQAAQTKAAHAFTVGSPASLQKIEQQGLAELRALTATAPSQIKGSLAALAAADEKLYAALQKADFDVRKVDPSVLTGLDTPEFTKSMKNIEDYLSTTCGIKVSPSA